MSEADFGLEVPEADRLEQLQDARPIEDPDGYGQDEPPAVDPDAANPADVLEQHVAVPADDEEE